MKKNSFIASVCVLLVILVVFGAANFGMDKLTADTIANNESARATGAMAAVLPGGGSFQQLDLATLADVPAAVTAIYQESTGLGYVVETTGTSDYSEGPLTILMGVDATGAIAGMEVTNYQETKGAAADFIPGYIGQNSTLADVQVVAGVTYTSNAFKAAVTDAFTALSANGLVAEAQKGADQLLRELIPTVHSGLAVNGVLQVEESAGEGSVTTVLKALNGSGFAYLCGEGEGMLLAVANNRGSVKVYDAEGNDVTEANAALAEEASAHAAANAELQTDKETAKLQTMVEGTAAEVSMEGIFSSITGVYDMGNGMTGFVARPYAYQNTPVAVYYVLDANGAIVKTACDGIIIEEEYFKMTGFEGLDTAAYAEKFTGMTKDSFTGEEIVIAKATITTDAMKAATNDIFAAFETLKGGA